MVTFKNALFIAAIGLVVLFSGCTGTQQGKVSETAAPTPAVQTTGEQTPVATSSYQLALEVKTLADCIVSGTKQPCTQVNLDVKNNNPQSLDVAVVKNTLGLKDGRTPNMYDSVGGLSTACVRSTGLQFKLSANTNQNLAMCYPLVHKSDAPTLNLGVMINGERKDYPFDLTKYGLTD
ncbi:MAG: hypothetical protein ABOK23_04500 [Candidatus Methanoperedens sp.]|nr:hypothetical protein [Candidatus Methanoperedens sp.]MCZ7394486.1 hypothetical protein [Candidatus Methanoperedens sp.]